MKVELLNKLKRRITRNANRFNMHYWGVSTIEGKLTHQIAEPPCHTQACLAGEALLMLKKVVIAPSGLRHKDGGIPAFSFEAANELGLSDDESLKLFYFREWGNAGRGWPKMFSDAYNNAKTPAQRAKVACARIDHFIKTDGRE